MNKYIVLAFLMVILTSAKGQGCSDAGFCTMGAMKPDQDYNKRIDFKLRSISINAYYGTTTLTPIVKVLTADATFSLGDKTFVQIKIPYQTVTGNLGETSGLGDISLSLSRTMLNTSKGTLSATIGTKIPSNDSDLENNNTPFGVGGDLPMYYQVSLGSYDLIAGAAWINDKWLFATGIQIALTQNKNDFRWGQWAEYPDQSYLLAYDLSNDLLRGIDVMIRVERNWRFTNFNFSFGLLPIYRITKDERLNFNTNERQKEPGTTGLALSMLFGAGYNFNINNGIKLIIGKKLIDRDVNPDGLTRNEVYSFTYVYRF